jgi:hypothetical protein
MTKDKDRNGTPLKKLKGWLCRGQRSGSSQVSGAAGPISIAQGSDAPSLTISANENQPDLGMVYAYGNGARIDIIQQNHPGLNGK